MDIKIKNTCNIKNIEKRFNPIIKEVIEIYKNSINNKLIDLRLMGSVARGDFSNKSSDIDFIAIIKIKLNDKEKQSLNKYSKSLSKKYDVVTQVDLDYIEKSKLNEVRKFILQTDSITIFGKNIFSYKTIKINNKKLAKMITPNLNQIIKSYKIGVINTKNKNRIKLYSRWTGKDILKCFRYHLILDYGIYNKSIKSIYNNLIKYYPNNKDLFTKLFQLYKNPTLDKKRILDLLNKSKNINMKSRTP